MNKKKTKRIPFFQATSVVIPNLAYLGVFFIGYGLAMIKYNPSYAVMVLLGLALSFEWELGTKDVLSQRNKSDDGVKE